MGIMNLKGLPSELKPYKNWVLYGDAKIPLMVNGERAKVNDSTTWSSYEEVLKVYEKGNYKGIGFIFDNTPYTVIDIDHCISSTGMKPKAYEVMQKLNSWTETSQSGTGLHIIVEAEKVGQRCKNPKFEADSGLEIYNKERCICLTGKRIEGTPATVEKRQEELNKIYMQYLHKEEQKQVERHTITDLSEKEVLEKCFNASNGSKFKALYNGDLSQCNNDKSSCDQALCNMIAFFTDDYNIIDSILKSSALYREKWNRQDYKSKTINNALTYVSNTYDKDYNKPIQKADSLKEDDKKAEPEAEPKQEITKEEYLKTSTAYHLQNFIDGIKESANTRAIETGFKNLDNMLDGGLYEGLYIVGAISSLGKTTFTLQIADQVARNGEDVLIFSLEMARNELIAKSISRNTLILADTSKKAKTVRGITQHSRYSNYSQEEKELIQNSIKAYGEYSRNIYIHEGLGNIGVNEIKETVEKHINFTGKKPIVLIDYLQILSPYDMRATDKQNTDKAVMELKRISRDYKIPVIGISSFNRENYNNAVSMTSFKESGAIEYSSDVLIGLQFKRQGELELQNRSKKNNEPKLIIDVDAEKRKDPREIELKILKNRNGRTGESVYYKYYPLFNLFEETKGV